jgi:Tfp pilus assembly pilus retraction ATPase PilT
VLLGTQPVKSLIRDGKANQLRNAMQIALGVGHKTLEMSLTELVSSGTITMEAATLAAFVPHEVNPDRVSPLMA